MIRLHTDAAVDLKTKRAGIGFVVIGNDMYEQISVPLDGSWDDNHTAEWKAVDYALRWLLERQLTDEMLFVYTDSQVVSESIIKEHTKNEKFKPFYESIKVLLDYFPLAQINWIPERKNRGADNLAKQALAKAKKNS